MVDMTVHQTTLITLTREELVKVFETHLGMQLIPSIVDVAISNEDDGKVRIFITTKEEYEE